MTTRGRPRAGCRCAVTSLVGRDALVVEVLALVATHRLVTLLGPAVSARPACSVRSAGGLRADRPDRPVVMCELADGGRGVGRRRRRRGAGDRRPSRRRARRPGGCRAGRHRDRAAARQLRARPRPGRRAGRTAAGDVSQRDAGDDEPGAAARRRRAAVHRADAGDLGRRRSRGAAVRRAGARRGAGLRSRRRRAGRHRRDRAPARWAAAGDRAGGRPAAHARRRRGRRRPGSPLRAAVVGLPHVHSPRVAQRGGVVVVRPARSEPCSAIFADLSVFAGPFTADRGGGDLRGRRRRRNGRTGPARRALARDAGARPPVRAARDAARVRRRAARRRPVGPSSPASATPVTSSSGSRTPTAWRSSRQATRCSPRSTTPSPSCAPRSVGCSTTARSSSPAAWSRRSSTTASCASAPTCWRGRSGWPTPIPTTAARWRRRCGRCAAHAAWMAGDLAEHGRPGRTRPRRRRAGRRRPAVGGVHGLRQRRPVRAGGSTRPPTWYRRARGRCGGRSGAARDGGEHAGARPRLRRRSAQPTAPPPTCSTRSVRRSRRTPRTPGSAPAKRTWRSTSIAREHGSPEPSSWPSMTKASIVAGIAGASKASIDARVGDAAVPPPTTTGG